MRRIVLAVSLCLAPLVVQAQTTDQGTMPAPVPSVPPPSAQTGGGNVPPERVAPAMPGATGGSSELKGAGMHDRDAPQSSVPANR